MRNTLTHVLIAGLVVLSVSAFGAEHPELKAFPAAKEGMERFVIVLPDKERGEEDSFMVEIMAVYDGTMEPSFGHPPHEQFLKRQAVIGETLKHRR